MTTNPSWQPSVGRQGRTFAFLGRAKLGKSVADVTIVQEKTAFFRGVAEKRKKGNRRRRRRKRRRAPSGRLKVLWGTIGERYKKH
eukprot:scaffold128923_cov66-Phaeocystis_antarctica.AAC.2